MAKKILIVDDNLTLCKNLSKLLVDKGYEVESTGRSEDIWDILKTASFDLMVLDLIFPEKNITAVLGGIKSASPQMRIVIYTGYEEYENSPYIRLADAFLVKSKGPEPLLSIIEKLIG
ncbi:MAG: response regulator [Candidatus Omnitrophota bacterium]